MGDAQTLSPEEQLRTAREQYEQARDLTLAIEEEFAILDPETLSLTNRFEELQAAAKGTPLGEHLVGELIASEVEVRTGRCDDFEEAAAKLGERRTQLAELAGSIGVTLGATGTHPWSPWQEQRIIDTPHYRRNDELLRYVVWRNNSFGLHVHVAIKGPDRAVAVCNGLRNFLPELLALSCSSPFLENVNTGLHSVRTQIFTRMFPRCGVPDPYEGWDGFEQYVRFLYDARSIDEHTQIWWSVRPHLAFPTVEIRICDAQPELGEARALAALCYALTARIARAIDEGEPLPSFPAPADRGEPLAGDPLRAVRRADRPRKRRDAPCPGAPRAAARLGLAGRRASSGSPPSSRSRSPTPPSARLPARGRRLARGDLRGAGPSEGDSRWLRTRRSWLRTSRS